MSEHEDCYYCRRQEGREDAPPGGYLLEDADWSVCHGWPPMGAGSVMVVSRRHFLDFGGMNEGERAGFGELLGRLVPAIRRATGAERVYLLSTMANVPHFHAWLHAWPAGSELKGPEFLAADRACTQEEAEATARRIGAALGARTAA